MVELELHATWPWGLTGEEGKGKRREGQGARLLAWREGTRGFHGVGRRCWLMVAAPCVLFVTCAWGRKEREEREKEKERKNGKFAKPENFRGEK
jgi:hypothetical protein